RRAIPLRRARCGELRPCAASDVDVELDAVAARNATRWMHDDALANVPAFGIKRLLHDERSAMFATREDGARAIAPKSELQRRMPAGRRRFDTCRCRIGDFGCRG